MNVRIRGSIYKVTFEDLLLPLHQCFGKYNLNTKVRQQGEECKFKNNELEFDCYSSLESKWDNLDEQNFIVDAAIKTDEISAKAFIELLSAILIEHEIMHEFEYIIEDDEGNEIQDEISIRPEGYDSFMDAHYS